VRSAESRRGKTGGTLHGHLRSDILLIYHCFMNAFHSPTSEKRSFEPHSGAMQHSSTGTPGHSWPRGSERIKE
jgi:hypothetical protein